MKAIETIWRGYRFRSRLEARWAVLLSHLGCRWSYEPQGFVLNGQPYLPDFWIPFYEYERYEAGSPPECGFWLEIKPTRPTENELNLCRLLSKESGHCVYLAAGSIGVREFDAYKWHPRSDMPSDRFPDKWASQIVSQEEWYHSYPADETDHNILLHYLVFFGAAPSERYCFARTADAIHAARSARFEHGESP